VRIKSHGLTKLLALLFAFTLVAAACGDSEEDAATTTAGPTTTVGNVDTEITVDETSERQYGGSISVGLEAEAPGLRPWEDAFASPVYNMAVTIYDKLMEQRTDGSYGGWLAEGIESNEDFTVWTLTLREGVTFHNGEKVTAQTLADMFVVQQAGAQSSGQISAAGLVSVEATDDVTAVYTLGATNSAFPAYIARAALGMVFDPAAATADSDGYANAPIGTGPFMIESRDVDNQTVVVRNPNYWKLDADGNQLPYLDQITFRPIPDEGTRLDSLSSGTVDVMQTLRQGTIRDARNTDGLTLYEHQGNNTGGGMYNVSVAPLDDVRVRNALTMMNNQESVIAALGGEGISNGTTQWFGSDSPYWSQAAADAWPVFDFDGAKVKLQEYVDDPTRSDGKAVGEKIDVDLSCPPDPTLIAAMQVIEQVWTASEMVNVTLSQLDQATHINTALGAPPDFTGTHQAHCWRWSSEDDPSFSFNTGFAPPELSPVNFSNYFDAEMFGLLQQAVATVDFDERKALYEQVNLILARDTPIWYSGGTATMIATLPNVQGVNGWTLPDGTVGIGFPSAEARYAEVWLEG
jgi:peptide/nickel transport system substrate-binding protein